MPVPAGMAGHPDTLHWNARYGPGFVASFAVHPLAARALAMSLPAGPVLELACGPSGSALAAAAAARAVTAVDCSDVALGLLAGEAERRELAGLITPVHADLAAWSPEPGRYALVLCTGYWDGTVFGRAARVVAAGGLLAWEGLTTAARRARPGLPAAWCLGPGEPATLLPPGFAVLDQRDQPGSEPGSRRAMLARNIAPWPGPASA